MNCVLSILWMFYNSVNVIVIVTVVDGQPLFPSSVRSPLKEKVPKAFGLVKPAINKLHVYYVSIKCQSYVTTTIFYINYLPFFLTCLIFYEKG